MRTVISAAHSLRFQGERTTRLAQGGLLSAYQLEMELAQDKDPYLGSLPPELKALEHRNGELLRQLDALAGVLVKRNLPKTVSRTIMQDQKTPFYLERLGRGAFGGVYRLEIAGRPYAFKLFRTNPKLPAPSSVIEGLGRIMRHGPYAEPATGLYFTHLKTRDLARFYVANPSARWQLTEYIDESADCSRREGKTLTEHGYMFQDDFKDGNKIAGVRVDYGGYLRQGPVGSLIQKGFKVLNTFLGVTS